MTDSPTPPDPRVLIDEATTIVRQVEADHDIDPARASMGFAHAQALATIAQASALLQPTPDEVLAMYEGVTAEADSDAGRKLDEVLAVLDEARRDGSRRHPAIVAAVNIIEGR